VSHNPHGLEDGEGGPLDKPSDVSALRVSDVPHTDISKLMNPGTARRQSLEGFDEDYVDIVDYIVRSTHKIWEERNVGLIYSHYRHNVLIHTSDGQTYGRDDWIAASLRTMAAFPDCRLYADDVIWTGDDQAGFHSSHRIVWTGHNTGYSLYGPPTGRKVVRQGIAHCFVKQNRVVEEWVARDELALVRQLGFDEIALAKRIAAKDAAKGLQPSPPTNRGETERLRGQMPPDLESDYAGPEGLVRRALHEVWNWRMVGHVNAFFAPNLFCWTAPHRLIYGLGEYKAYVLELLAAFPDLTFTVDHQCALGDEERGYRVATRWFLDGSHQGPGPFGEPTGRQVHLLGISHHDVRGGKITREHTAFDAFALLKQLYWPEL
jgi:predicted ester cyclase